MPESEEALLRRAAAVVRERGAVAAGEPLVPWVVDPSEACEGQEVVRGPIAVAESRDPDDAAWIALVGPQLAEPLAAWLEKAAGDIVSAQSALRQTWRTSFPKETLTEDYLTGAAYRVAHDALDVARVLLGVSAVPAPEGDDHQEGQP